MKILALETSAKAVSAAVTEDGTVLAYGYQNTGLTHSRTLMPIVEGILANAGIRLEDCGAVAVAVGPGSFTGIRIGVAAAKGLAFAAEKPAVGVSTLEAMARTAVQADGLVVCAMDARRSQVYNALFRARDGALARLTPDRAIGLAELAAELENSPESKIIVGDGARLCYTYLLEKGISCRLAPPLQIQQNAVGVALAAEEAARRGETVSAQALLPVYLRPAQAERLENQRKSKELSK
jgi:tRNA threonylcarbamoyladenosine biosynthesis protein TsaB